MTESKTTKKIHKAEKIYNEIVALVPSFDHFPTEEEQEAEHKRIRDERINIIQIALDETHGDGYTEGVRHEQKQ